MNGRGKMTIRYLKCDACGAETPFGERARLIFQEDSTERNYWHQRKWKYTGRTMHVCRDCAERIWKENAE